MPPPSWPAQYELFNVPRKPELKDVGGRALREMTRLVANPYSMWWDIVHTNTAAVKAALNALEQRLVHVRESLRTAELRDEFERESIQAAERIDSSLDGAAQNNVDITVNANNSGTETIQVGILTNMPKIGVAQSRIAMMLSTVIRLSRRSPFI
jgi:hypothetical protein